MIHAHKPGKARANRTSPEKKWETAAVLAAARQRLVENCPYAFYFRCISLDFTDGVLTLKGRLPTFYMKQILQSLMKNLDGVRLLDDQVEVVSSTGLSSVRAK